MQLPLRAHPDCICTDRRGILVANANGGKKEGGTIFDINPDRPDTRPVVALHRIDGAFLDRPAAARRARDAVRQAGSGHVAVTGVRTIA